MMRLALTTSANLPFGFKARVSTNYSRRELHCDSLLRRPRSHRRLACLIKDSSGGERIDSLTKFSSHLRNLAPQPIKDFPWERAKLMAEEHIIVLGKNALTWSLVALLVFSFAYDALMAFFASRELLVPLGLFIGVLLADFLNESCQDLFETKAKGGGEKQQLWGIGLFFVAVRCVYLRFRIAGWVLFCHLCNGGLMQILWLAKEMKQPEIIESEGEG